MVSKSGIGISDESYGWQDVKNISPPFVASGVSAEIPRRSKFPPWRPWHFWRRRLERAPHVKLDRVTEPVFLREAAWVILCAGMKETVVRSRFAQVSDAFLGWCSARGIVEARRVCRRRALSAFKNVRKIN